VRRLLLAALLAAPAAQAQMYKCLDARGVTQYTDKPCAAGRGGEVDIRGQPPISGKVTPYREDLRRDERDFQRRESQRERERQADEKQAQARQKRCEQQRAQLLRLEEQRRIASVNAKGERVFLDDSSRQQRVEQLRAEIARSCG